MKATLALEDGTLFTGTSFGAQGSVIGEIVFNTGMTGYQEVLTDASYAGQIVTMTYPLIGNYGVNEADLESEGPQVRGFIVRECSRNPSNWRSTGGVADWLASHGIIGIEGIDTRALTRILREKGTMNGIITTDPAFRFEDWAARIHAYRITHPVETVTVRTAQTFPAHALDASLQPHMDTSHIREHAPLHVVLMDYGVKTNIVRNLNRRGCDVTVMPATATADEVLALDPDGIMLSNGPGDPKDCVFQIAQLKRLLGSKPIFGICLGHQLTALAVGGDTSRLKYGHRGGNHPVKDLAKDRTYITSQNHGYAVEAGSLPAGTARVSHINMNDMTVEGVQYLDTPTFTVQFHPEASPGPMDTGYLFDEFIDLMRTGKAG
jgi:carbamoyl-phosphate synthase small subunit